MKADLFRWLERLLLAAVGLLVLIILAGLFYLYYLEPMELPEIDPTEQTQAQETTPTLSGPEFYLPGNLAFGEKLPYSLFWDDQGQQVDIPASEPEQQTITAPDPSNNIRIDAKGADVVFEVKDGVYSISINASESVQDASASVPETKSSVNWYEIIKIVLLAALVVNMLWKQRKETTKC